MFSWCCPTAVPCCRPSADQGAGKVQPQLKPSAASRAATLVSLTGKPKVVAESVLAVLLQHTLSLYTTQGEAVCIRCTFSPTQCACRVLVYSISRPIAAQSMQQPGKLAIRQAWLNMCPRGAHAAACQPMTTYVHALLCRRCQLSAHQALNRCGKSRKQPSLWQQLAAAGMMKRICLHCLVRDIAAAECTVGRLTGQTMVVLQHGLGRSGRTEERCALGPWADYRLNCSLIVCCWCCVAYGPASRSQTPVTACWWSLALMMQCELRHATALE
jgi:hypothetical protein